MRVEKICPDCSCDYLAHVETCVDCGTVLLTLEEYSRLQAERQRLREEPLEEAVSLRQGELQWLEELSGVLLDSGVSSRVLADPSCGKGCRATYHLLVSRRDAAQAHQRIEDHFARMHPEAREAQERMRGGRCPACGADLPAEAPECPDCGLALPTVE